MMKIGLATHTFVPEVIGGRETHVKALADNLSKDNEVIVFAGSSGRKVTKEVGDYTVYRIPSLPIKLSGGQYYRVVPDFYRVLKRERVDIMHAHDYGHFTTDVSSLYSMRHGVPFLITIHGHFFRENPLKVMKYVYDRTLGFLSVLRAGRIICVSDAQKNEVFDFFGSSRIKRKISVIPNGIHLDGTGGKCAAKGKTVFAMGRMEYRKGFHLLLKAAQMLKDTSFVIAGPDAGEAGNLRRQIAACSIDNVLLMDSVSDDEKARLFSEAGVFVIPSLYEGLPTTLLEAMMHGKPVVCSDLPGMRGAVKDGRNGFLVRPGSASDLTEKISMISGDDELARTMGRNNMNDVRRYDWKNVIKEIEGVYREVMNG
jgi:glycosyltransferase involved in cell wall biosynthesis